MPDLPIQEIRGAFPGPTVALVAGVHGGKVAAVHALDSLSRLLRPELLHGVVLLVRPANRSGFDAGLAQTTPEDGLNLNRVFPGRDDGSYTERLAARILRDVVARSDFLVDLHGSDGEEAVGRFAYAARSGLSLRTDSAALRLATLWGLPLVVWDEDGPKTLAESRFLQTAAHLSGVPAITVFEAGDSREDPAATAAFVAGASNMLRRLGVLRDQRADATRILVLARRDVTLASAPGTWTPSVSPARPAARNELLGVLLTAQGTDSLRAPAHGFVLHQRLSGAVTAGTPLVILGLLPQPSSLPRNTP